MQVLKKDHNRSNWWRPLGQQTDTRSQPAKNPLGTDNTKSQGGKKLPLLSHNLVGQWEGRSKSLTNVCSQSVGMRMDVQLPRKGWSRFEKLNEKCGLRRANHLCRVEQPRPPLDPLGAGLTRMQSNRKADSKVILHNK